MKKLMAILMISLVPAYLFSQSTPLSSLYDKFVSEPGFETTEILPSAMSFDWEAQGENPQIREILNDIESVRFSLYSADKGATDMEKIWKKMQKAAGDDQYKEVMTVNADKVQFRMLMMKSASGSTREIAVMEKDEQGLMLLTFTGDINLSDIFRDDYLDSIKELGARYMKAKAECNPAEE